MILRHASRTLIVIPARLGSTRLPAKVLKPLAGVPVVEWVRRAALKADCGKVVVAVDHAGVAEAVRRQGGWAVMTSTRCASGSDRVAEAARAVEGGGPRFRWVINLQGDEPFIRPATIRAVLSRLTGADRPRADIATAVVPLPPGGARDPNVVKAVVGRDGRCLYFSRSPVPFARDGNGLPLLQHIGIYGYRRDALDRFVRLPPSPLERCEQLEQLRALEAGMTIAAARVRDRSLSIDTQADLRRAVRLCRGLKP